MSFSNSRVVIPVENKIISLERRAGACLIFIRITAPPGQFDPEWLFGAALIVALLWSCEKQKYLQNKNISFDALR